MTVETVVTVKTVSGDSTTYSGPIVKQSLKPNALYNNKSKGMDNGNLTRLRSNALVHSMYHLLGSCSTSVKVRDRCMQYLRGYQNNSSIVSGVWVWYPGEYHIDVDLVPGSINFGGYHIDVTVASPQAFIKAASLG